MNAERRRDALAALAILVVGAVFLREILTLSGVPLARDMQLFFIPQRRLLWEAFQARELPLWTAALGNGFPLLANFQSGVFYPPDWLYGLLPFFTAFNTLLVLHFLLGGLGAYALLRELEHDAWAGLGGAVAYMLGGYFVSLTNLLNVLQVAAWAPLVLLVVVRFSRSRGRRGFLPLLGVVLLAFLAGEPQTFLLAAVLGATVAAAAPRGERRGRALRAVAGILAAGAATAVLAAVQVLPTVELVLQSERGTGLGMAEGGAYALSPARLLHLLVPPDYHDPVFRFGQKSQLVNVAPWLFSVYPGVVVLALAAHGTGSRERRGELRAWWAVGAVGLVLALGEHTPVFPWLFEHLPGFALFRYPEKYFFFTAVALAVLTAAGIGRLRSGAAARHRFPRAVVPVVVLLVPLVGLLAAVLLFPDAVVAAVRETGGDVPFVRHAEYALERWTWVLARTAGLLAVAGVAFAAIARGKVGAPAAGLLLVSLVTVDLFAAHRHTTPVVDPAFWDARPAALEAIDAPEDLALRHRYRATAFDRRIGLYYHFPGTSLQAEKWIWQQTLHPSLGAYWGRLTHDSDDAIELLRNERQEQLFEILGREARWRLLRLNSVRYLYSPERYPPDEVERELALDSVPGRILVLSDPVPRAYLARGVEVEDRFAAVNVALDPAFPPTARVALSGPGSGGGGAERAEAPMGAGTDAPDRAGPGGGRRGTVPGRPRPADAAGEGDAGCTGDARVVADRGTEVRVRVAPAGACHLVLTDVYYPGWTAAVDGERRPIRAANHFFRAVAVGPGDREVVFRYRPRSLRIGAAVTVAAALLLGAGLAALRRQDGVAAAGEAGA